jgi:SAM-dependent methyltransferase
MTATIAAIPAPDACVVCRVGQRPQLVSTYAKNGTTYGLFECASCAVQFWYPNAIADQHVYDNPSGVGIVGALPPLLAFRPPQLDFLKKHAALVSGARLLDIGCGDGGFMEAARRRGARVWGVDYNTAAIERARRNFGLTTALNMALERWIAEPPVADLDVVTAFEVVEHVADPFALIRGAASLLRPGGHLVVSVPSRERLLHDLSSWDYPPHHLTRWNEKAIVGALESNGFRVVEVIYQRRFITILKELADAAHLGLLWGVLRLRYRNFTVDSSRAALAFLIAHACSWAAEAFLIAVVGPFAAVLTVVSIVKGKTGTSMAVVARKHTA